MMPKEKATELHKKFMQGLWKTGNPNHVANHGKECALLCVDEILSLTTIEFVEDRPGKFIYTKDYWQEVRREIEAL